MDSKKRLQTSPSLSVKQVAERYGFPKRTLYHWISNRVLAHTRIGTRVFIDPGDLEELKRKNRIEAINAE